MVVPPDKSVLGVNVPVQLMSLEEVIVDNEPIPWVLISTSLLNPETASENTKSTVAVSPAFNSVSLNVKETIVGAVVSIIKFLLSPNEFAPFGVGKVNDAALPALSKIEPVNEFVAL